MRESQQLQRLVRFVAALKRRSYPNARSFSRYLHRLERWEPGGGVVATKTIKRDVACLRESWQAPVIYDAVAYGYVLEDQAWTFPYTALRTHRLFGKMLGEHLSLELQPPRRCAGLPGQLAVNLAAGEPRPAPPELLEAAIAATSTRPPPEGALSIIVRAWRECWRLRVYDAPADGSQPSTRDLHIHALFLAGGRWWARAYRPLRHTLQSIPLDSLAGPQLLDVRFVRSPAVLDEVRQGYVFDYDMALKVKVRCAASAAPRIRNREWFAGQRLTELPNGELELLFESVNRQELVWWILSHGGLLEVMSPPELRTEVLAVARRVAGVHGSRPAAPVPVAAPHNPTDSRASGTRFEWTGPLGSAR